MNPPSFPVALFRLGRIVTTPKAREHLTPDDILTAIQRHQAGDWGDLHEYDRHKNQIALAQGLRLVSVYNASDGARFYVITEPDRSLTTLLLPEDY